MEKKKLVINTSLCDARNVSEETLESYENITINAAIVVTTPESGKLLHKYNVVMNCSDVVEIDKDVELMSFNGKHAIHASDAEGKPAVLMVNGSLTIEPGAEKAVSRFVSICVNGSVSYPESMASSLGMLKVNGSTTCYPDDAIMLNKVFIVDKTFIIRCKNSKYYAQKCVVIVDPELDIGEMVNKGVQFITNKAIVAESLLESSLPLFQDSIEIITVPDGCRFIDDDVTLSKSLLLKYGTKLYIRGDLAVGPDDGELLKQLDYLYVNGSVRLQGSLEEVFFSINAEYRNLEIVRDKCIMDKIQLYIDNRMLSENPGGITVIDCVNVSIASDVSPELILERLQLKDCVNVRCSPEQRSAVEQVADDVVNIEDSAKRLEDAISSIKEGKSSLGDLIGNFLGGIDSLKDIKVINAANYKL